jgi:hypothetical protein
MKFSKEYIGMERENITKILNILENVKFNHFQR